MEYEKGNIQQSRDRNNLLWIGSLLNVLTGRSKRYLLHSQAQKKNNLMRNHQVVSKSGPDGL
jgi:hypothetical protein